MCVKKVLEARKQTSKTTRGKVSTVHIRLKQCLFQPAKLETLVSQVLRSCLSCGNGQARILRAIEIPFENKDTQKHIFLL